jgi:hypothetical protein
MPPALERPTVEAELALGSPWEVNTEVFAQAVASVRKWSGASRLTTTGSPLEFSFASYDDRPRLSLEVGDPTRRGPLRLKALIDEQPNLPTSPGLRFFRSLLDLEPDEPAQERPAWLARRGRELDLHKLYLGLDHSARSVVCERMVESIGGEHLLSAQPVSLLGIGFEPQRERFEVYCGLKDFESWHLNLLLRRLGLREQVGVLDEPLRTMAQRPLDRLPKVAYLSFDLGPLGAAPSVALHFHALALTGTDQACRRRLLALAGAHELDLEAYENYSRDLETLRSRAGLHTMLSLAVSPNGFAGVVIGMAPVESAIWVAEDWG